MGHASAFETRPREIPMLPITLIQLAVLAASPLAPPQASAQDSAQDTATATVAIVGAHVLAPEGDRWLDGHTVLLRGTRIESVERGTPSNVRTLDATGLYLIPGLIDLHSHLLLHPYDEASWNDQVLKESLELRTIRGVVSARRTLEAGFTTLRELGTEGAGFADVALRDAVASGMIPGPRIFTATRALVATGCYGPSGFDPRWTLPKGAQEADGVVGVRVAVRQQIAAGADWIKVYADYRRKPGDPSTPTYSLEELRAIVDEATSAGVPVAAHASTDEAITRAVMAGVRTIEHGSQAGTEVLELMASHGVVLIPTLAAAVSMARYGGWRPGDPDAARITSSKAAFTRALASGVIIACGSDVGVFSHGDNALEIELMAAWGMDNTAALRAATSTAAKVLGREDSLGRVAPGFLADLVALRRDPLADPSALREPVLVVQEGRTVVDKR